MLRRTAATLTIVLAVLAVAVLPTGPAQAANLTIPHASVVPETVSRGYPIIQETPVISSAVRRQVKATDQVGRNIVSGGDFLNVELPNGTVIPSTYFAAWSIDSKQLVCPGQFSFNGEVLAVEPGPVPNTVYVGGRFAKAKGADGIEVARNKVALLNLATCAIDPTFVSTGANGKVNDLVLVGDRLFIGGDFTAVSGRAIETLAELDARTGAVNPAFTFPTSGELADRIVGMGANAAGTRLVFGGRFGTMTGSGRSITGPTGVIDISVKTAPVLTAHQSTGYAPIADLQDVGVAPDGSTVALAYGTATTSDYVYLTPTTEASTGYRWRHFLRDSAFGIAVSNNAVYAAGHFCKPDSGPGATDVGTPKMGFDTCTGTDTRKYPGGAWRSKLAAFSLSDGTPFPWNPGQASFTGGRALTVTNRGLLVGYDGERTQDARVGALAMFDFGPTVEDTAIPGDVTFTAPAEGGTVRNPASITATATDDVAVVSYRVSLQNSDGRWVQPDGTLASAFSEFAPWAKVDGSLALSVSMPAGTYTARAQAVDPLGQRSANVVTRSFVETGIEGVPPATTLVAPTAAVPTESNVTITGLATDNVALKSIVGQVRDGGGRYLQPDRTLKTTPANYPVTITSGALGTGSAGWSMDLGNALPARAYTVTVTVTDTVDNVTTKSAPFTVSTTTTTEVKAIADYNGFATAQSASTVGSTFTVSAATKVAGIGIFDANRNGRLDGTADVASAIWNQSTKAFVAQVTVPRTAPSDGGWFYANFITPVTLQPGVTYVVGHQAAADGEPYASNGSFTQWPGITYTGRASVSSTKITYPTSQSSGVGYGVDNLRILATTSTVPVATVTSPTGNVAFGQNIPLAASATDNASVAAITFELKNSAGQWLKSDGTFSATKAVLPISATGLGSATATASYAAPPVPVGNYTLIVTATDSSANIGTASRAFSVGGQASAGPAVVGYSNFSTNTNWFTSQTVGSQFTVAQPTKVTALGIFDSNGNGRLDNSNDTPAGLWRQSDRALLAQAVVSRNAPSENRWFYANLATPVILQPGVTYVAGYVTYSFSESYAGGGTITPAAGITYTGRASGGSSSLGYPSNQSGSTGYGVPNFKFVSLAPPVLLPVASRTDKTLEAVNLQFAGNDPDGGSVTYSATGLPDGLALDPATGAVTGTPTTIATYPVTVTVTDDEGATASISFTWSIIDGTPPPPCVVTPAAGGGMLVDWIPVANVAQYSVRRDNAFLATVNSPDSAYTDPAGTAASVYAVRYTLNATTTDLACIPG